LVARPGDAVGRSHWIHGGGAQTQTQTSEQQHIAQILAALRSGPVQLGVMLGKTQPDTNKVIPHMVVQKTGIVKRVVAARFGMMMSKM
jgi:hypothetical protein